MGVRVHILSRHAPSCVGGEGAAAAELLQLGPCGPWLHYLQNGGPQKAFRLEWRADGVWVCPS